MRLIARAHVFWLSLSIVCVVLAWHSMHAVVQAQALPPRSIDAPRIVFPPVATQPAAPQAALAETAPLSTTFTYVGGYQTSIHADQLVVSGTLALVTDSIDGLRIIDVRNPTQPQLLTTFKTVFRQTAIDLAGTLLAIADPDYGVYLVDLQEPSVPRQVGAVLLQAPETYEVLAIELTQSRLFVSTNRPSLEIFDIRDPAHPQLLGTYDGVEDRFYATRLIVIQDTLYLTGSIRNDNGTWLEIINITNPAQPQRLGHIGTSAQDSVSLIQVVGNVAYLSGSNRYGPTAILTVDVTNPADPQQIGGYNPPAPGRLFRGAMISGGIVFAGIMDRTVTNPELYLLSTSDLVNLPPSQIYQAPQLIDIPNNLVVQGVYLYVAENRAGLRIYRINYPYRVTVPLVKRVPANDARLTGVSASV